MSDSKYNQPTEMVFNDHESWAHLVDAGYEPTGITENGFSFTLPYGEIARLQKKIIDSDGSWAGMSHFTTSEGPVKEVDIPKWAEGMRKYLPKDFSYESGAWRSLFKSPDGHSGLLKHDANQTFDGFLERNKINDQDVYAANDLSMEFKRGIQTYTNDREKNLREQHVLAEMAMFNIDPGSYNDNWKESTLDFFAHGGEILSEGFLDMINLDGDVSKENSFQIMSNRKKLDILDTISNESDLQLTAEQKEEIERGFMYEVTEGVAGFIPAIAEFAAIEYAMVQTGNAVGAVGGVSRFLSKIKGSGTVGKNVYRNTKSSKRLTEAEVIRMEKAFMAPRGSKAFNNSAAKVGIKHATEINNTNRLLYHGYMGVREEIKMKAAFDEDYHMGGGIAFYGIGRGLNKIWGSGKLNQLNTLSGAVKSGTAGMVSVQAAQAMEAMVADLAGNKDFSVAMEELYPEGTPEFRSMMTDFFVFKAVGAKGWLGGSYSKGSYAFRTTESLRKIKGTSEDKIVEADAALKKNPKDKEALKIKEKYKDLADDIGRRLDKIEKVDVWQDPIRAKRLLEKMGKNYLDVFKSLGVKDPRFEVVNNEYDMGQIAGVANKYAAASVTTDGRIVINTSKATQGKVPHEVTHMVFEKLFEQNPAVAQKFKNAIKGAFNGVKIPGTIKFANIKKGWEVGDKVTMNLEQFIKNEYGARGDFKNIKAPEYVAYAAEILANGSMYSKLVTQKNGNVFGKNFQEINRFTEQYLGKSMNKLQSKQDIIDFLGNFVNSVKGGTLTTKQVNMFRKVKNDGIYNEIIKYDGRVKREKNKERAETEVDKDLQSKDILLDGKTLEQKSAEAQRRYEDVKGNITQGIDELLKIDASKPSTSVAGKLFDPIVYNTINRYNATRNPEFQVKGQDRYDLAMDLVYDLNGGGKRGLKNIIQKYHDYKPKEGEVKQPLTKTVMQQLNLRIHEIKSRGIDMKSEEQGGEFGFGLDISEASVQNKLGSTEQPTFEFKSRKDKLSEKKGLLLTNDMKIPTIEVNELKSQAIKNIINAKGSQVTFEKIAEMNKEGSVKTIENWLGKDPLLKKSEYYDIVKDKVFSNNDLLHKSLPLTSHPKMYENSNIAKTVFKELYRKTNERFSFREMPTSMTAKERAAGPFKWEKLELSSLKPKALYNIVYKGSRKDVHAKNVDVMTSQIAKVLSSQVTRTQLNNKAVQEALGNKDLGLLESLKIEQVIDNVKEKIKGSTPENLWSTDNFKILDKFEGKYKEVDWASARNPAEEIQEIINTFPKKDRVILEKYQSQILKEMQYDLGKDIMTEFKKAALAQRKLGSRKNKVVEIESFTNWADLGKKLKEIPGLENNLVGQRGWSTDKMAVEQYDAFVEDLYNSMPLELSITQMMTKSTGAGQTKFERVRRTAEWTKGFIKKLTGNGEVGGALESALKEFRIVDNGNFKRNLETALQLDRFKKVNSSPEAAREFAEYIKDKYLTRKGTKDILDDKGEPTGKTRKITWAETVEANEQLQEYVYTKLYDMYAEAKPADKNIVLANIYRHLQQQTNIGNGFSRGLPTHNAVTLIKDGKKHSEHELQVLNFNANFVKNMIENAGNKEGFLDNFRPVAKQFKQSVIEKEIQEKYDGKEFGGNTGLLITNTGSSQKQSFMRERVIAETTLDLKTGKTYDKLLADQIGAGKGLQELQSIRESLKERGNGYVTENMTNGQIMQRLNSMDIVLEGARDRNKKRKGISVFDFDDTLAKTNSQVIVTMPDGKKMKINATEFAKRDMELTEKGAKYDFSEFNKVIDGKKGPLFDLAMKRQGKFGTGDVFVLTARPQGSAVAIHKFLKGIGLDIPLKNITGLENGTPEAKSGWVMEKAKDGYNDFYFADDAYKNVKAVKDVLSAIDVKSKVQLALNSVDLGRDIGKMMSDLYGVDAKAKYSDVQAKIQGKQSQGGLKFIPYSHQDFMGLVYPMMGKGKLGNINKRWWIDNFQNKFNQASINIAADQIRMIKEFNAMKKDLVKSGIPKDLRKEAIEGFTHEQVTRVTAWSKQGMEVPGISKRDLKRINDFAEKNPGIKDFANKLIEQGLGTGYPQPGKNWLVGTITTDLMKGLTTTRRAKYLKEWKDNVDIVFSPEKMNMMEAKLGTKWRESMENMLQRMATGKNRSHFSAEGGAARRMENEALDWLNNSVGTIMFLNTRSAMLQTISNINYINWTDNNPMKAGKAVINQKQYWTDFVELINSDFMKQRRGGLQINVSESEIAEAASQGGGVKGGLNYLLKKGFLLTQGADSFAIATGGATFFRNRINTYKKQGMTESEAKKKAFLDFRKITEETQQSSRADMISMQQASGLGRTVLAFANTPSQYARLMDKAAKDLMAGRGSKKENLSKIVYYGFVQNLMFNALQNGLFSMLWDDDSTEEKAEANEERSNLKKTRIINGMTDSILRGTGVMGAALATVKNMTLKAYAESQKKRPRFSSVGVEMLSISPPLSSKVKKVISAGNAFDYDMKTIKHRGFGLDNPAYLAGGQVVSAFTNVPLDRAFKKYNNVTAAWREDTETLQDLALMTGYSEWELGIDDPKEAEEELIFAQQSKDKAKLLKKRKSSLKKEIKKEIQKDSVLRKAYYKMNIKQKKEYLAKELKIRLNK